MWGEPVGTPPHLDCDDGDEHGSRRRILRAALGVFAEFGFAGASTREIARRAGVHQPALAYHFGNKEELWKAAAGTLFTEMIEDLRAGIAAAGDPEDRLRTLIHRYVGFVAANPEWYPFVIHEALQTSDRNTWLVENCYQPMSRLVYEGLTAQCWPEGESLDMARTISMMAILSGATSLFVQRAHIQRLTGIDTLSPDFVEQHAEAVFLALSTLMHAPEHS